MNQEESDIERKARTTLEKYLYPGEPLLGFTQASMVGLIRRKPCLMGLTFLLVLVEL